MRVATMPTSLAFPPFLAVAAAAAPRLIAAATTTATRAMTPVRPRLCARCLNAAWNPEQPGSRAVTTIGTATEGGCASEKGEKIEESASVGAPGTASTDSFAETDLKSDGEDAATSQLRTSARRPKSRRRRQYAIPDHRLIVPDSLEQTLELHRRANRTRMIRQVCNPRIEAQEQAEYEREGAQAVIRAPAFMPLRRHMPYDLVPEPEPADWQKVNVEAEVPTIPHPAKAGRRRLMRPPDPASVHIRWQADEWGRPVCQTPWMERLVGPENVSDIDAGATHALTVRSDESKARLRESSGGSGGGDGGGGGGDGLVRLDAEIRAFAAHMAATPTEQASLARTAAHLSACLVAAGLPRPLPPWTIGARAAGLAPLHAPLALVLPIPDPARRSERARNPSATRPRMVTKCVRVLARAERAMARSGVCADGSLVLRKHGGRHVLAGRHRETGVAVRVWAAVTSTLEPATAAETGEKNGGGNGSVEEKWLSSSFSPYQPTSSSTSQLGPREQLLHAWSREFAGFRELILVLRAMLEMRGLFGERDQGLDDYGLAVLVAAALKEIGVPAAGFGSSSSGGSGGGGGGGIGSSRWGWDAGREKKHQHVSWYDGYGSGLRGGEAGGGNGDDVLATQLLRVLDFFATAPLATHGVSLTDAPMLFEKDLVQLGRMADAAAAAAATAGREPVIADVDDGYTDDSDTSFVSSASPLSSLSSSSSMFPATTTTPPAMAASAASAAAIATAHRLRARRSLVKRAPYGFGLVLQDPTDLLTDLGRGCFGRFPEVLSAVAGQVAGQVRGLVEGVERGKGKGRRQEEWGREGGGEGEGEDEGEGESEGVSLLAPLAGGNYKAYALWRDGVVVGAERLKAKRGG